jgi:hypothetical protein
MKGEIHITGQYYSFDSCARVWCKLMILLAQQFRQNANQRRVKKWSRKTVQTATLEPNTTTIQNHFWDGSGDGISTFVQAGKNISPDCLLKKK